ncbi:MAG: tRNA (adenosine(37)-N6)-dimethylallyltransferase MiaA [Chthonomonadales bacterium]
MHISERIIENRPIIAILGSTASGKTSAAINLAQSLPGEIISADSMAVYRGLDIGTAKPTSAQQALIPYHLIDVADPIEEFQVSQFQTLAKAAHEQIKQRGMWTIVAGGTGFYVKALLDDMSLTSSPRSPEIRDELEAMSVKHGPGHLHEYLTRVDAVAANRIHPNDKLRLVRALEVFLVTGIPISEHQAIDQAQRKSLLSIKFGLFLDDAELHRRIETRVELMIKEGFLQEVQNLMGVGLSGLEPAMTGLGYKELVLHLRGDLRLEDAIEEIKKRTRQYAKRQRTWFKADKEIMWVDVTHLEPDAISEQLLRLISDHMNSRSTGR